MQKKLRLRHFYKLSIGVVNCIFRTLFFEVDCKSILDGLMSKPRRVSDFYALLDNCYSLLCNSQNSRVSLVRRQANQVVHSLVKAFRFKASHHVYERIPMYIYATILNDMK